VIPGTIAVGSVSSAAFNPAVVFALNVAGVLQWKWIWLYLLAELLGATLAALVFRALNPEDR
jgi:aquaporin Z